MITINDLGNCGRLGNQMFQYASIKGISKKHGYEFAIPPRSEFGKRDRNVLNDKLNIYDLFDLSHNNFYVSNYKTISEKPLNFDKDLFENCPDNINLEGYFQSQKYFEHIKDDIKKDFSFNNEYKNLAVNFISKIKNNTEIISLHIRRGDYLKFPSHHPICSIEYYNQALGYFPSNAKVVIFTDDFNWCKKQKLFESSRFLISENNNAGFDLCLMSFCDYHIIANSSFSWWGAWLSDSKGVIAPKKWFGESYIGWNLEDRILKEWIVL